MRTTLAKTIIAKRKHTKNSMIIAKPMSGVVIDSRMSVQDFCMGIF